MPYTRYLQITEKRYNQMCKRFDEYMARIDDMDTEPIKVFDPLGPKHVEELELIREVSKNLQDKRDEDMRKTIEAAAVAEQNRKEAEKLEAEKKKAEANVTEDNESKEIENK